MRCGEQGAEVWNLATGEGWRAPAVPVPVVDPVGAGNAFCGAFLAAWLETNDLAEALLYGVTAASFFVERVGQPIFNAPVRAEAARRLEAARACLEPIRL